MSPELFTCITKISAAISTAKPGTLNTSHAMITECTLMHHIPQVGYNNELESLRQ